MKKLFTILAIFAAATVYGKSGAEETAKQEVVIIEETKVIDPFNDHLLSIEKGDYSGFIGGAARFNYTLSSWDKDQRNKGGDLKYDVFIINAMSRYKNFSIHAEYRQYANSNGGGMLNNGYLQYVLKQKHRFQLGLMKVPFGNTENSNSYYFTMAYYVGLEGDDDAGIKYTFNNDNFEIDAAFFKNSDMDNGSGKQEDPSRFSFDIMGQNQETNTGNARFIWKFGDYTQSRLGVSGMYGGIYNIYSKEMGSRYAFAAHYQLNAGDWTLRAQYVNYMYSPKNAQAPEGSDIFPEAPHCVTMGAYGSTYNVADQGNIYTASLRYDIPLKNRNFFSSINVYGEANYFQKTIKDFSDSQFYVVGANLNIWRAAVYVEYLLAKNQPFLGNDWTNALGAGNPNEKWNHRININLGFYF